MSANKKHPYHLIDPSPWPFVGSLSALLLGIGAVLAMHKQGPWVLYAGVFLLIVTMVGWWRDMLREATPENHTPIVETTLRWGVVLFIISEVMFFVAFFWSYFHASLFPSEVVGGVWPPKNIQTIDPFRLPYLNTLLLLLSGTTVTWAHHSLVEGDHRNYLRGLACTIGLGVIFSCIQALEYAHAPFGFTGGIYPSNFYMATGFHGFHVFVGTIFLIVCWVRGLNKDADPKHHIGFEAAAWYWHFVDVVWLFLFVSIYWAGAHHAPGT
jgi:cytochrome c oxidase subunit 3